MMVISALRSDGTLLEFLESHARVEPVRWLVGRAIVALAVVGGGFGPLPFGRQVIGPLALTYFSYAAWGLLDRGRSYSVEREWTRRARYLNVLCQLFVVIGVASALGFILSVWFLALGSAWVL